MFGRKLLIKLNSIAIKLFLFSLLCFLSSIAVAQVRDAFKLRGPGGLQGDPNTCIFTLHGDFTMIANVNLWANNGTDNQTRVNNSTNMKKIDLDGISSTLNSSMAELKLYSSCSKIVYAGLYWTAKTSSSVTDAAKKTVKIKGPGASTYNTLTTPMYSRMPGDVYQYICFTDVTQYVKQQGAGQYWVADIALTEGSDDATGFYAGWGMVVVYEDSDLPMRNIAMFDGYAYVSGTQKFTIPVSGFKSVQTGPVKVKLGFMAGEGDATYIGDWCQMRKAAAAGNVNNDNDWIHLENPSTAFASQNFWRSRVTNDAGAARNPNYTNNLGFDAFVLNVDNTDNQFIGNNQTSSAIRYGTSSDQYIIFNMTMAVDAYEPNPEIITQVSNGSAYVDQTNVGPGDIMTYKVNVTNQGNEAVLNTKLEIPIPYNASYVANSIVPTFDASLSGATATYDPAGQKIVINIGTLPIAPANDPNKIFASISYKLKATTDCYYLKNPNPCLRNVNIQGSITGTGAITGVSVNKKTISGFQGGTCSQTPITTPTTSSIVVPSSYTACDSWQNTTANLRICPGTESSIPTSTIRSMLTLPSSITYVFNSTSDGTGIVYNDNNPFPTVNGTYYAVPVNAIDPACSGSIPFTITILSVNTPPTTPSTSLEYCPSNLPVTLSASATSSEYSVFWYTQATGGNSVGGVTIPTNTSPGTYTYYVAQGYDAVCQSTRIPITVKINSTPSIPTFNGSTVLCGGLEDSYGIVSPNTNYIYEWVLENAPAGIAFKNGITTGVAIILTETITASGTFTLKVRAKDNITGCYGDYRSLSITVNPKPNVPSTFTGPTEACENSAGNIFTLNSTVAGMSYEWSYSGTGYAFVNGSNVGTSTELQFNTGASSGSISVKAKSAAGCYSDAVTKPFVINIRPAEPTNVTADNICIGQNGIIKINNSGTLKYQVYSGTTPVGGLITGNNGVALINIGTFNVAGNFSFSVKSYNDKCYSTSQTPVSFTVLNIPQTPIVSSSVTTCYNTSPVVQILNAELGISYKVYDNVALSGSPLNTAIANVSPLSITVSDNPTANKTYYIVASNGVCTSAATSISVIVREQIILPILNADNVCAGQKPSIIVSNAPMPSGIFDTNIYQYKVYSNSSGTLEIALLTPPEQISTTELVLRPNRAIASNTTLYVRLIAYGCSNSSLSSVNIQIAPRQAPSVLTPVTQCLGTRALITIHNSVKGNHYRVYDAPSGGTAIRDIVSLQSGDMIVSMPFATPWTDGTLFYVEESVRDDADQELCLSPRAKVVMQSGTPDAPAFIFNPTYTCSGTTATVTIKNALRNHTYKLYNSETDTNVIYSLDPGDYYSQYPFTLPLPASFETTGGTITYWMDMVENGSTCNSQRTSITITLATPTKPTIDNASLNLIVCRGSIPVIPVNNAKKDIIYTIYNMNDTVVAGPVTATADGILNIPITGITLTTGQVLQLYLTAQSPTVQNNCVSEQTTLTLTDGEPTMPLMPNITVCHGSLINISIPSPIAGYTYYVYDFNNTLVGTANASGNVSIPAPNIINPNYPNAYTDLHYYVKAQSTNCLSESNASFIVKVTRTVDAVEDFTVSNSTICEDMDAVVNVEIKSDKLINSNDLVLKWYNNSDLTSLYHTQQYVAGTNAISQVFSNLSSGVYVYYLTAESASANLCQNKPEDAGIVIITVKPHAIFSDLTATDTTICNNTPVTLSVQLVNSAITNQVFNWYTDVNHTTLIASNVSTYTPASNLTTSATYYVTVQNASFCENRPADDQQIIVVVNELVQPPVVATTDNIFAICSGTNLMLEITPIAPVSGYELWENGSVLPQSAYDVNTINNTITVLAPSVGNHTYTVVSQVYTNNILCKSDHTSVTASLSIIVNDPVLQPSITLDESDICQGDNTLFHVVYTGLMPSDYLLYSGTAEQDKLFYTISGDMETITFQQPLIGNHSYTLVSLATANTITCKSEHSTPVISNLYPHPSVSINNIGATDICKNDQAQLQLDFTGTPPFTYTVQAIDANNEVSYVAQNVITNETTVVLDLAPSLVTSYFVSSLTDAHCAALVSDLTNVVTINVYPDLNAGALVVGQSICNNTSPGDLSTTFAFDGNTTNYEYSWQKWDGSSFADIFVDTADYNPGNLTTGEHRFQRTISDGCQTETTETIITVRDDLQAGSLIASTAICNAASPNNLNANSPTGGNTQAYTYSWQYWNGISFEEIVPIVNTVDYNPGALASGIYRFQRTVTDGCETKTTETTISVYSNLNAGSLIAPTSICLNNSPGELNLDLPTGGNATNYTYLWQKWDGSVFIDISPAETSATYTPDNLTLTGNYIYQRVVTDGCQTASVSVQIGVYSDLNPGALLADTTICYNTSPGDLSRQLASLCGNTTNISYEWFIENTSNNWTSLSITTPNYNPGNLTNGVYHYRRDAKDGSEIHSVYVTITVLDSLGRGSLIADTAICNNTLADELNFNLPTGGNTTQYTYSWQLHDGNSFQDITPVVTTPTYNPGILTAGIYRYQRTITDGCETKTIETTITVYNDLDPGTLITDTSICEGILPGELNKTLPSGGDTAAYTYSWQLWNGTVFSNINPLQSTSNYSPTNLSEVKSYPFQRTITDGCQTKTVQSTITINQNPTATIGLDTEICNGETIPLNFTLTGKSPWIVTFTYGDTNTEVIETINTSPYEYAVTPSETTTYRLKKVVDENGCSVDY